jgi:hypothetical protein
MAIIDGVVSVAGLPRDNAEVRLYPSSAPFAANPPQKNTPFPATGLLQTVTSGPTHGGNGEYRFTGVTAGQYYAGANWNGTIVWSGHDVQSDTNAANVKQYGAVGDGLTDDTAAFQAAVNDAAIGELLIGPGTYKVGNVQITARSNFRIRGAGGVINWFGTGGVGNQIGFQIVTSCTNLEFLGVRADGNTTANDKHAFVWCNDGVTIEDLRIIGCHVEKGVRGVKLSASASGSIKGLVIEGNYFEDVQGTSAAQGEPIFLDEGTGNPAGARIIGNVFVNSRRYDIHVNQIKGLVVSGNTSKDHRLNGNNGTQVPCFRFIRVRDVICEANILESYYDGGIEVAIIAGAATSSVAIRGNKLSLSQNAISDIAIGSATPAADGAVEEIDVLDNEITKVAINQDMIRVNSGLFVKVMRNTLVNLAVTATVNGINLQGAGDSGGTNTYNNHIFVADNIIRGSNGGGGAFRCIGLESAICTSIALLVFARNICSITPTFAVGANVSDTSVFVFDQNRDGLTFAAGVLSNSFPFGGITGNVRNVTTTATLSTRDLFVTADGGGGAFTINLPAVSGNAGLLYVIIRTSAAGNITVDPSGAETINGAATKRIDTQYGAVLLFCDGTTWHMPLSSGTIT